MTVLSRLTALGGARETGGQGVYLAPTFSIPWTAAEYQDVIEPLKDESVRANDSVVQGITEGPRQTDWSIGSSSYGDILPNWFVAMGLFDSVTAGVSTTVATGGASAGATSFPSVATIPSGSTVKITGSGGTDYVVTGAPSGPGPFTIPITSPASGLVYAHPSGDTVSSQTTHTFKQNRSFSTVWPSYSFTTIDGAAANPLGWAGCVASELALKIDPKGLVGADVKFTGWPSATASSFSYAASSNQPVPGWDWTVTNAGGGSTRGLTFDVTLKRAAEAIHASTGAQAPREVFAGALEIDGSYKAIFENDNDRNLFLNYTQTPTVHTLAKPLALGGESIAITMSVSGYTTAKVANNSAYLQLDLSVTGIQNSTDGGVAAIVVKNFVSTTY